ncbi:MAG: hypothetical protein ACR2FG_15645 [Marmoricola sp.]
MAEHFDLQIPGCSAEQAAAAARAGGVRFYQIGLHVRVRGDRIRARYSTGGKYDMPPVLRGRVEDAPGGARIVGRLRWWAAKSFVACMGLPAVLLVGLAVLAGQTGGGPGVVALCAVGAFVFAMIAILTLFLDEIFASSDRDRLSDALLGALEEPSPPPRPGSVP